MSCSCKLLPKYNVDNLEVDNFYDGFPVGLLTCACCMSSVRVNRDVHAYVMRIVGSKDTAYNGLICADCLRDLLEDRLRDELTFGGLPGQVRATPYTPRYCMTFCAMCDDPALNFKPVVKNKVNKRKVVIDETANCVRVFS